MIDFVETVINQIGYVGVAFLTLLENVFPPIASEVVLPFAGFAAERGDLTLWGVIAAGTVGSVLGALPLYYLGVWWSEERVKAFAEKHGKWLTVSAEEIERADRWLDNQGQIAVFVCRLIPGIRSLISIPAGWVRMSLPVFLLWTTLGTALWSGLLAVIGYWLGQNWRAIRPYMNIAGWAVFAALLMWLGVRLYRRRDTLFGEGENTEQSPA